ncbi:choice-of-anchor K domain-containing protein [Candidatus Thiodictyon syntrophicum]|jgi:uncharacterized membrane protein|nr:choice-of-anchor K domain-containing protein [Candidatus Thiodictyon syntrophicum]
MIYAHSRWYRAVVWLVVVVFYAELVNPAFLGYPPPQVPVQGHGGWITQSGHAVRSVAQRLSDVVVPAARADEPNPEPDPLLAASPEFDLADPYLVQKADALGRDPQRIFAFVRDEIGFESYTGSLRGARGTLWSKAGNALDKSSLLIALLRISGVSARYVRGVLDPTSARQLIASMFQPSPYRVLGFVPESAEVADPVNDPSLIHEAQAHFWVELEDNSAFLTADPSFRDSILGKSYANHGGSFDKVPTDLQHKVTVRILAERTQGLLTAAAGNERIPVFEKNFSSAELVGHPLSISHFINSSGSASLFGTIISHTYTPYVTIGDVFQNAADDTVITGDSYQEHSGVLGFGSAFVDHLVLDLTLARPNGGQETISRVLAGRNAKPAEQPFLLRSDVFTLDVESAFINDAAPALRDAQERLATLSDSVDTLKTSLAGRELSDLTQEERLTASELERQTAAMLATNAHKLALEVSDLRSHYADLQSRLTLVKAYLDGPRALLISQAADVLNGGRLGLRLDYLNNSIHSLAFPQQATYAVKGFALLNSSYDTSIEEIALGLANDSRMSVGRVFAQAKANNVGFLSITNAERHLIDGGNFSEQAKRHMSAAIDAGRHIIVPSRMIEMPTGEMTVGWYDYDPQTGVIIDTMEDGGHTAMIEYGILGFTVGFLYGFAFWSGTLELQSLVNTGLSSKCHFESAEEFNQCYFQARQDLCQAWSTPDAGFGMGLLGAGGTLTLLLDAELSAVLGGAITGVFLSLSGLLAAWDPPVPPMLIGDLSETPLEASAAVSLLPETLLTQREDSGYLPSLYRLYIRNEGESGQAFTVGAHIDGGGFDVVSSLDAITIPAGETGVVGIMLNPVGEVPSAGTKIPLSVTVEGESGLSEVVTSEFIVPEVKAISLQTQENANTGIISAVLGSALTVPFSVRAVGNTKVTDIPMAIDAPRGVLVSGLPEAVTVDAGATVIFPLTIEATEEVERNVPLTIGISATFGQNLNGDPYVARSNITVVFRSQAIKAVDDAASAISGLAGREGVAEGLPQLVSDIAQTLSQIETDTSDPRLFERLKFQLNRLQVQLPPAVLSGQTGAELGSLIAAAASRDGDALLGSIAAFMGHLRSDLTQIAEHSFKLAVMPRSVELSPGGTGAFALRLENKGSKPTTIHLAAQGLPAQIQAGFSRDQVTMAPGEILDAGSPDAVTLNLTDTGVNSATDIFAVTVAARSDDAAAFPQTDTVHVAVRTAVCDVVDVAITPNIVNEAELVNLARTLNGVRATASSAYGGYPTTRAIDGSKNTSWFTAVGDAANKGRTPFYEIELPESAVVRELRMSGNRQYANGYDFKAGIFDLIDAGGRTLWSSGVVLLPAPERDLTLPIGDTSGVRRIRFTATDDENTHSGFSELEVLGLFPITAAEQVQVSARLNNAANLARRVTARFTVLDGSGQAALPPVEVPVDLATGSQPTVVQTTLSSLGALSRGLYRVAVEVFDQDGGAVPGRSAYSVLYVGVPVRAQAVADPEFVPPGSSNVDTLITVSRPGIAKGSTGVAFTGEIQATFTEFTPTGATVTGVGTRSFTWGAGSPPSGFVFQALPFSGEFEQIVSFGTLDYYNGTISNPADKVTLELVVTLTEPVFVKKVFTYELSLINTANTDDPEASADYVYLPDSFAGVTFTVNGTQYTLEFLGFGALDNNGFVTTIDQFHVYENAGAHAELLGRVTASFPTTLDVTVEHGIAVSNYSVLLESADPAFDSGSPTGIRWTDHREADDPSAPSFRVAGTVPGLLPGEVREISLGTNLDVTMAISDGDDIAAQVDLPPVVVVANHLLGLSPPTATVAPGGFVELTVSVDNPLDEAATFDLSVIGLDAASVALVDSVTVPARTKTSETLRIGVSRYEPPGMRRFSVVARSAPGWADQVTGQIEVLDVPPPSQDPQTLSVGLTLTPEAATAGQGTPASYNLRLTNLGDRTGTFDLSGAFPPGFTGELSARQLTVPPGLSNYRNLALTVTPPVGTDAMDYPFTLRAVAADDAGVSATTSGVISVSDSGVVVDLNPTSGSPTDTFQVTVTNTGEAQDSFDLTLGGPLAPVATLSQQRLTLAAGASQTLSLTLGPVGFAAAGVLRVTVIATSRGDTNVHDEATAQVTIPATRGLDVAFDPRQQTLPEPGGASFRLMVHNTGNTEGAFQAVIAGTTGPLSGSLTGLDGQSTQSIGSFRLPGLTTGAIVLNAELARRGSGTATVQVISLDDAALQAADTAELDTVNVPPVADAGVDRRVPFGLAITLDGSASDDPDGRPAPLTYRWSLLEKPAASNLTDAEVADADQVIAGFTPDARGLFRFGLRVNDGQDSASDEVRIEVLNNPPVANAGADRNVETGQPVTLDGSGSYDPDQDLITFDWRIEWALDAKPLASQLTDAGILNRTEPNPTLTPDVDGDYVLRLIVSDPWADSEPDDVTLSAHTTNVPPNAEAGPDQDVFVGNTVNLLGGGNDPDHGPAQALTYRWTFANKPTASLLRDGDIADPDQPGATFIPDLEGTYQLRLTVFDGADSGSDDTAIRATIGNIPPVADAGADTTTALGQEVRPSGSNSQDPDNGPQPLRFAWVFVSVPPTSGLTSGDIADADTPTPSFVPDLVGQYVLQLRVDDGRDQTSDNLMVTVTPALRFQDVTGMVQIGRSAARSSLDRRTGRMTTAVDISLTNRSSTIIGAPLEARVLASTSGIAMPTATRTRADGSFVFDLAGLAPGGSLKPGETITFPATFVYPSNLRLGYQVQLFGMAP